MTKKEIPFERMRQAIVQNRGGWEAADELSIRRMWQALPEAVRAQYLEALDAKPAPKRKEPTDA